MGPEKETTRGSCGTWAEGQNVLPSGTGAGDERLVGRDEKQQRNKTRGEARRLSFISTTAAKKASRQLCTSMGSTTQWLCSHGPLRCKLCSILAERGPDTIASVPRGNDGCGSLTGTGSTTLDGGNIHSDVCNYECLKQSQIITAKVSNH